MKNTVNKKAIVTIIIGKKYREMFDIFSAESWKLYANKYSYDLILLREPLDGSIRAKKRSPAWQKLLILSQSWSIKYKTIVWIDADIIINNKISPDISLNIPENKIGAVDEYEIPNRRSHSIALLSLYAKWKKWGNKKNFIENITPMEYYQKRGIQPNINLINLVQTGVFVCSPKYHKKLFEHIYYEYEDNNGPHFNYEMPAMSYEILKNNLQFWISPKFNYIPIYVMESDNPELFNQSKLQYIIFKIFAKINLRIDFIAHSKKVALLKVYNSGYFIHFAGCSDLMRPLLKFRQKLTAANE